MKILLVAIATNAVLIVYSFLARMRMQEIQTSKVWEIYSQCNKISLSVSIMYFDDIFAVFKNVLAILQFKSIKTLQLDERLYYLNTRSTFHS